MNGLNKYTTTIIVVIFICVTFLTYTGKVTPHLISTLIGAVIGYVLKQGATFTACFPQARSPSLS